MSQDEFSPIKLIMMNKWIMLTSIIACLLLGIIYAKNTNPLYKTQVYIKLNHLPPFVENPKMIIADFHMKALSRDTFKHWQKAKQKNLIKSENAQLVIKEINFSRLPDKNNDYLNSITVITTGNKFNLIPDYLSYINKGITSKYVLISKQLQEKYLQVATEQNDKSLTYVLNDLVKINAYLMRINNEEPMFTILNPRETKIISPNTYVIMTTSITLGFILGILLSVIRRYIYKE